MPKSKYIERRSLRNGLSAYLTAQGWTGINYEEGFLKDEAIVVPCVSVHFMPSNFKALQMGRDNSNSIKRVVQIDCYMESEPRADAISETIADFIEMTTVSIKGQDNIEIGVLTSETETISWQTLAPILNKPKIIRWRAIVRATLNAYYYD